MRALVASFLLVALVPSAAAQKEVPVGPPAAPSLTGCTVGAAEAVLDVGDVRAALYNTGGLFWRGSAATYEVPSGSGIHAQYVTSLWIGGAVNDSLHFAGSTYFNWEYRPGPLDGAGETDAVRCAAFDRLWSVRYTDLVALGGGGPVAPDVASWPVAWGAPFYVDANGNSRRDPAEPSVALALGDPGYGTRQIDLAAGERPDIVGDQGVWWLMNDNGAEHTWSLRPALKVEVRVLAYGFDVPEPGVAQSTFYRITVTNRNTSPIEGSRVGFFADYDLGQFNDDYFSADSTRGMAVAYNSDENDDGGGGYGTSPPALGFDLLSGMATANAPFKSGGSGNLPRDGVRAWSHLNGRWADGTPITRGGDGYNDGGTEATVWRFDGDPTRYRFWSEDRSTPEGRRQVAADRRTVFSTDSETLAPGASRTLDLAMLFAEGGLRPDGAPRSRLTSVARLREISDAVQAAYDAGGPAAIGAVSVAYAPPRALPGATTLVAPANGTDFDAGGQPPTVTFEWTPAAEADAYLIEVSDTTDFVGGRTVRATVLETQWTARADELPDYSVPPTYWRVTPLNGAGQGPATAPRTFTYTVYTPEFTSFEVTANAAGPLVPPEPGALGSAGFPTRFGSNPGIDQQSLSDNRWLIFTGSDATNYDTWRARVTRGGATNRAVFPFDFEMRFTGSSRAAVTGVEGQTGADVTVPFELWNVGIGTPDDPSDDVRMIPVLHDLDGNGAYALVSNGPGSYPDSPISSGIDDPFTDEVTWRMPADASPGAAGYAAFVAARTADPTSTSAFGADALYRTALVSWNGIGRAVTAPLPEAGTVFRIVTPTPPYVGTDGAPDAGALALGVYPNPLAGGRAATVPFTLDAAADVRLSVVDVLGREVAVLAEGARPAGRHEARLAAGRLAAGVYVVVLRAGDRRAVRTLTVVR